jgi:hypothetical protein
MLTPQERDDIVGTIGFLMVGVCAALVFLAIIVLATGGIP